MAKESKTGYRFAGDIDIKQSLLISITGQIIDIEKLIVEYNFYQSLHEHYMQCDLVIQDAVGLIDSLKGDSKNKLSGGFTGGEMFIIKFAVPGGKDITLSFALYELTDRSRIDEKFESYMLSGISIESYFSSVKKISRSYGPNNISKMVKSIVDEFIFSKEVKGLYNSFKSITNSRLNKEIFVRDTSGLQKYIIPNMTVGETIELLSKEANNSKNIPFYRFYEDTVGFKFEDVNELIKQDIVKRFTYIPTIGNEVDNDQEDQYKDVSKIIKYTVQKQSNILNNSQKGLFRSKTINLDILRKTKTESNFDYEKRHSDFNTLQKFKIPGSINGDPVLYMMQSRTNHDQDALFTAERPYPKKINQSVGLTQSYKAHIFNTVVDIIIPGDETLIVGNTIYLEIPVATTLNKKDGQQDKYLSGKYFITKIRHQMKEEQFFSYLECVKDTGIEI